MKINSIALAINSTKYEGVAQPQILTKKFKINTYCLIKKICSPNRTKNAHTTLTITLASLPTGFILSWLGLTNQNFTADVLFMLFYKLAERPGANCFFYSYIKTDKFFC